MFVCSEGALLHGRSSGEGVRGDGVGLSAARLDAALPVDVRLVDGQLHGAQLGHPRRIRLSLLRLVLGHRDDDLPRRARRHTDRQHPRHARGLYPV